MPELPPLSGPIPKRGGQSILDPIKAMFNKISKVLNSKDTPETEKIEIKGLFDSYQESYNNTQQIKDRLDKRLADLVKNKLSS